MHSKFSVKVIVYFVIISTLCIVSYAVVAMSTGCIRVIWTITEIAGHCDMCMYVTSHDPVQLKEPRRPNLSQNDGYRYALL
jgi:hypothetical protein